MEERLKEEEKTIISFDEDGWTHQEIDKFSSRLIHWKDSLIPCTTYLHNLIPPSISRKGSLRCIIFHEDQARHWAPFFSFILLIQEGSHPGSSTRNSNPVMTSSAGPVPRVVQTTGSVCALSAYTVQLHQDRANNQCIGQLIKSSRL